jgi:hypothetical protein
LPAPSTALAERPAAVLDAVTVQPRGLSAGSYGMNAAAVGISMCCIELPVDPELPVGPELPIIVAELPIIVAERPIVVPELPTTALELRVDPERPAADPQLPAVAALPETTSTATTTISKRAGRHRSTRRRARMTGSLSLRCIRTARATAGDRASSPA